MTDAFTVGRTRDLEAFGDIGLELLAGLDQTVIDVGGEGTEVSADAIRNVDALLLLSPRVTAATVARAERLKLIARFGVGYDNVDVDACTGAGVLLTITPDGVRRPVASSVLAYILALSLRMFDKDRLMRAGRWADKPSFMGLGLSGRTLGIIGLGNIGREIIALSRPLGLRYLAFDPYATPDDVDLVDLDTLLRVSDFVTVNCALTAETYHLLNRERLALLKPTAYLINTARGGIVDQAALTEALTARRIAGAALDVFEPEPIASSDPLLGLDNVILAPHAICWTDECFRGNGASACRAILDVAHGRIPPYVVNRAALDHPKLEQLRATAPESASPASAPARR
jgi:phosphoglycerate dehydrogenase-like enzyme